MEDNHNKIIDKIRKLFALAENNPNESEAVAAALKAQKLIAEYDINAEDLADEDEVEEVIKVATERFRPDTWRGILAQVIADNFRCKCYRRKLNEWQIGCNNRYWSEIVFIGYHADAVAALTTYNGLVSIGLKLFKEFKREKREQGFSVAGLKNGYLFGFCDGVRSELEKQSKKLMIVTPLAVIEEYDKLNLSHRTVRYSKNGYDRGCEAGRDAVRSSRIGNARQSHLLAV